jgi:hypothetical protein
LTYAAVSILKTTQLQVDGFASDDHSVTALARRASDILAQAACTTDHLPASQSSLISRVIDLQLARSLAPNSAMSAIDPSAVTSERYFGQSDNDLGLFGTAHGAHAQHAMDAMGDMDLGLWYDPRQGEGGSLGGENSLESLLGGGASGDDQSFAFTHESLW